jgi:hypothetical protein
MFRGAPIWNDQVVDGIIPLPDEDLEARRHRNGTARVMQILGNDGLIEAMRA